jgi:3-oxoadipate enol-lactonase
VKDVNKNRRRLLQTGFSVAAGAAVAPMVAAQPHTARTLGPPHGSAAQATEPSLIEIRPGVKMAYEDQYFGAPWIRPETVVLIHGNGESSLAWTQWVGPLSTNYRVIRPDIPGFGRSPIAARYTWSPSEIAKDIGLLLTKLGVDRFHLVGAKYGGSVAIELAADQPERVFTLSAFGTPLKGNPGGKDLTAFPDEVRKLGVRGFEEKTQRARLGSAVSDAQLQWWSDVLTDGLQKQVFVESTVAVARMNVESRLKDVTAPTLLVITEHSGLQSVAEVRRSATMIPHGVVLVMPGDSYHVAAANPLECAQHVINFIENGTA